MSLLLYLLKLSKSKMCSVVSNCPGSCFLQGKREVLSRSIVLHIFPYAWQQDARHATAGPQGFDQVSISGSPLVKKCLVVYLQTCEVAPGLHSNRLHTHSQHGNMVLQVFAISSVSKSVPNFWSKYH